MNYLCDVFQNFALILTMPQYIFEFFSQFT